MVPFLANGSPDKSMLVDLKKEKLGIIKLLDSYMLSKIIRQTNMMTHEIARFNFDNRFDGLLLNSFSPCVAFAVMMDCNNVLINY